jgi:hypothetical protein
MAERARAVYRTNVSYGNIAKRSGHWSDRLPGIDADLAAMKAKVHEDMAASRSRRSAAAEIQAATARPSRKRVAYAHTPPESFRPGQAVALSLAVPAEKGGTAVRAVRLRYRHANQAERWRALDASGGNGTYTADIPAQYTESPYPLEYYFELEDTLGVAWMIPGFNNTLSNQPYFAVYKRRM